MSVTVTGTDKFDVAEKLGLKQPYADIRINWRRGDVYQSDFGRIPEPGCIVDATSIPGEEVARSFTNNGEALRYLAAMLKKHEARVKEAKAKQAKEMRERLKAQKARQKCSGSTSY